MDIRPFQIQDISKVKSFTDRWIGEKYYTEDELIEILELSRGTSFLALHKDEVVGVRLTYAPGLWTEKIKGLTPKKWKAPLEDVAYFKSLFISDKFQQKGLGPKLSELSIQKLLSLNTKAILCHSWLESPNNSSQNYLKRFGFAEIARHPKYWENNPHHCQNCYPKSCSCTAIEMIKYL